MIDTKINKDESIKRRSCTKSLIQPLLLKQITGSSFYMSDFRFLLLWSMDH